MTIGNPYRSKNSTKKTQYMDMKSMSLQKKLSVIDKVGLGRTQTGKTLLPSMGKKVTFMERSATGFNQRDFMDES